MTCLSYFLPRVCIWVSFLLPYVFLSWVFFLSPLVPFQFTFSSVYFPPVFLILFPLLRVLTTFSSVTWVSAVYFHFAPRSICVRANEWRHLQTGPSNRQFSQALRDGTFPTRGLARNDVTCYYDQHLIASSAVQVSRCVHGLGGAAGDATISAAQEGGSWSSRVALGTLSHRGPRWGFSRRGASVRCCCVR